MTSPMHIVALHGAFGAPADFDAVWAARPALAAGPKRCLWLPGHDPRARLSDAAFLNSFVREESMWAKLLEHLASASTSTSSTSSLHLVGYSMGARLALGLALGPLLGRVRRLTLISGSAGIDDDAARRARAAVDDERAAALVADPAAFLADFWSLPLFHTLMGQPERDALLAARVARARPHVEVLARAMAGLSVGRQPSYWGQLAALDAHDVGVDIVVGEGDDAYVAHAARFAAALPRARVTTVPNTGHSLLIEAPTAVADVVVDGIATALNTNATASTTA